MAGFLGLSVERVELRSRADRPPPDGSICAIHCRTLGEEFSRGAMLAEVKSLFGPRPGKILIHGFTPTPQDVQVLSAWAGLAAEGVNPAGAGKKTYAFARALEQGGIPLAGLFFESDGRDACAFRMAHGAQNFSTLVSLNDAPVLLSQRVGDTEFFLLAGSELADLEAVVLPPADARPAYPALLPAIIFLRVAFPEACWRNPQPAANFIIDDPLLRRRYGFVEYATLLAEAQTHGYAVTIGFIPFNHDRTDRRVAEFLHGHEERFSIAVHGCDHTAREFGSEDGVLLAHKARLAWTRMEQHQQTTALPFDPVMVFPQGVYSTAALRALKRSGYGAAVNTNPHPQDGGPRPLKLRDFLDGAMMAHHSFPVFLRRYPAGVFDFAVDLMFGKPVLLVEHHDYFKSGCAPLAALVAAINRLEKKLVWMPLGRVVTSHAWMRPLGAGRFAVRFWSNIFFWINSTTARAVFVLEKTEHDGPLVEQVIVNGRPTDFTLEDGKLSCAVELNSGEGVAVKIIYRETASAPCRFSLSYRCSASARRYLSEFRDNYLSRHDRLLAAAVKLKNLGRRRVAPAVVTSLEHDGAA